MARKYSWAYKGSNLYAKRATFKKRDCQMMISYLPMTVVTVLEHPKEGLTKLIRYNVTEWEMENLFGNPRYHTGKGVYKSVIIRKYV